MLNLETTLNKLQEQITINITKQDVMSILVLETFKNEDELLSFLSHETGFLSDYIIGLADNKSMTGLDYDSISTEISQAFEIVKNYIITLIFKELATRLYTNEAIIFEYADMTVEVFKNSELELEYNIFNNDVEHEDDELLDCYEPLDGGVYTDVKAFQSETNKSDALEDLEEHLNFITDEVFLRFAKEVA